MHLIFERLKGATFQTELLVMTLLGLANCTLNWRPFDWPNQAEKIRQLSMTSEYSNSIKSVLRWVVIARIIIDHMYFASYLGNLYSVFTWCRPKLLLPWMIISAFKNFLLDFIVFAVATLLYAEGNFPGILFVEFIVERAITFVTAAYYWCGIKKLYVELREFQRRKLTRANLAGHLETDSSRLDDIVTSLANSNKLSAQSSFELDGNRERYRLTKSLTTLIAMDSRISVDLGDDSVGPIIEDTTLTPREKAMRILGLNEDDINERRYRLGKSTPQNNSVVKEMLKEQSTKVHDLSRENSKPRDEGMSSVDPRTSAVEMSATQAHSKHFLNDSDTLQDASTINRRNEPNRCTCIKSNAKSLNGNAHENLNISSAEIPEEIGRNHYTGDDNETHGRRDWSQTRILPSTSSDKNLRLNLRSFGPSIFWSVDFPRSEFRRKNPNLSNWSGDEDFKNSKTTILLSFVTRSKEDVERSNKVSNVSSQQRNPNEDNPHFYGDKTVQGSFEELSRQRVIPVTTDNYVVGEKKADPNFSGVKSVGNFIEMDVQTDFLDDGEQWPIDQDLAGDKYFPNQLRISRSAQTCVSGFGKSDSTNSKRVSEVLIEHLSANVPSRKPKPEEIPTNSKKMWVPGITRYGKMRNKTEKLAEREAREMRALKAYNRVTLLEDKREMDLKKGNSEYRNRTGLRTSFCLNNSVNVLTKNIREVPKLEPNHGFVSENIQAESNEIPKRQSRSRPQEKTSKLSTFNLGLDALENSISLSFSSQKKNQPRLHNSINNTNATPTNCQPTGRKQLSKYSKPMRIFVKTNDTPPSTTRIEGPQTGRDLERTCGVRNITLRDTIREVDRDIEVYHQNRLHEELSETYLSSLESLHIEQPNYSDINGLNTRVEREDKSSKIFSPKNAIRNIDWEFHGHNLYGDNPDCRENVTTNGENVLYDIIDDTDTISLLQSAFASNPDNTERGFYLGPGSTELYSVSNVFDDVVEQIMKTARLRPNFDSSTTELTVEVDYGDAYLLEFQVTTSSMAENSDDDTLTDSNSDSEKSIGKRIQLLESKINAQSAASKPVEMCWNSYSSEVFDTENNHKFLSGVTDSVNEMAKDKRSDLAMDRDALTWKNRDTGKGIAELLGEKEISYVEYWAKELKDLATNDRRNDFEFTKEFRHLTKLPGFCVVKMLVDFFRDFVAVSRSTMTSRMFLGGRGSSSPSDGGSEEVIAGQYNEVSNTSVAIESPRISRNLEPIWAVESDVVDSVRALIDRITVSVDANNSSNVSGLGMNDERSMFPLRDDQFYFGEPKNTHQANRYSISNPRIQGDDAISQFKGEPTRERIADQANVPQEIIKEQQVSPVVRGPITFCIFGATPIVRDECQAHKKRKELLENSETPFLNGSAEDSFDSLYSAGPMNSQSSTNVASIGETSTFEEFPEHTSISSYSIESPILNITGPEHLDENN